MKGSASRSSPTLLESPEIEIPRPRRSERLARKSIQMELDESDDEDEQDLVAAGLPPSFQSDQKKVSEVDTMDCFQSLSSDLKSVQAMLDQLHKLASSSGRSKDLALVGLQDKIS